MTTQSATIRAALYEARSAEKKQTMFYRRLAAEAEAADDPATAERLNGLLADEQHHLSRISARLLEWGEPLPDVAGDGDGASLDGWEEVAREREHAEISRYVALLELSLDSRTHQMIEEFLEAERGHAELLGGKWMDA